jgi:hypothetical protein
MLVHAVMAGSVVFMVIESDMVPLMATVLKYAIILNLVIIFKELSFHNGTPDTQKAIRSMTRGYFSSYFWVGVIFGNILPVLAIQTIPDYAIVSGVMTLVGIFLTEFVRIRVPQMIPLS